MDISRVGWRKRTQVGQLVWNQSPVKINQVEHMTFVKGVFMNATTCACLKFN